MRVRPGLEVFLEEKRDLLAGQRVGVIANPSSVDSRLRHIVDLFADCGEFRLAAILGPQHGFRAETQDNMVEWDGFRDPETGLPVYSLYGEVRKPLPEMLEGLDALVFDLQDAGARYYTFIHTMALAMEACREQDKAFVVLDRPNPINGVDLEGPVLDPAFSSFVGLHPLPVRHGMTVAEIALYLNAELQLGCRLHTVPMSGWRRDMFFDETGMPWVMPSPNIPSLDTALVYPGMCLLEASNVSEGRGSTRPFEISGAPWVQPERLASSLNRLELPGALWRPLSFIPTFHKWADQFIGGVQVHVTDRRAFRPFRTALELLQAYRHAGPECFSWNDPPYEYEYEKLPIDILCGTDQVRKGLDAGVQPRELETAWKENLNRFADLRRQHLLY